MTLPYNLTKDDLVLDPATKRRISHGELDAFNIASELGNLKYDSRERVTKAANELLEAISSQHSENDWGRLYLACLDTAMIWELG